VHFVLVPLPIVLLAVGPDVESFPLELVFNEFANVHGLVCENQFAVAMLVAVSVLSFVYRPVRPRLDSSTVLLVV
jgi:hypothetical protein